MAEKSFGVKDLNIVGASGDPTIESNGDLNLKAGQVAIQTNTTVTGVVTATSFAGNGANITGISTANIVNYQVGGSGGGITVEDEGTPLSTTATTLNFVGSSVAATGTGAEKTITISDASVPANSTFDTVDGVGIVTAGSFVTDLITANGTGRGFCTRYYITANGSSSYSMAGPGQRNTVANPTLYLMRGFTYMFENSTGGSHPFRIQFTGTTTGVGTYVSGAQNGVQIFTIPHDAPGNYEYQCTVPSHASMKGSFVIPS